jgi:integrase
MVFRGHILVQKLVQKMAKSTLDIPYIYDHGDAKRYRRIVPYNVREKIGRKVWLKSFPRKTPVSIIRREARKLALEHDREIALARGQELSPEGIAEAEASARKWLNRDKQELYDFLSFVAEGETDFESIPPEVAATVNAIENKGRYVPVTLSVTAAHQRDQRIYGGERDEKPFEYAVNSFVAAIGDKDVSAITRADVSEWLGTMEKDGLAPATVQRRLGALRAIINRAFLDFDHNARNPYADHRIKGGDGKADDRLPFNRSMLDRIDFYLAANRRLGHETKNIIRIMRNTGAGPGEVGGLAVADVSLDGAIPFVWIRANALRGVKAAVRDRLVPLVGEALEAARDAYKRAMLQSKGRNPDDIALFKSFGISGRGADSISAKLNKAIRAAGVPKSPRLTAYSFRHTIKEALRSASIPDHIQRRIMGHSGHGVADNYGSPKARLSEARAALELAMDHLGDIDPVIYGHRERT